MATPINNNSILSSEMVLWEGPNIPCIDLCTGEKVSNVVAKIGTKLCTLITDVKELETLDYTCMIEKFSYSGLLLTPENFSFKLLFQLLLDNDCTLKQLIDNIPNTSTTTNINLSGLDLKCITNEVLNLCGQIPTNLDINKLAQAIINILCGIQDDVADLLIRVITLEVKISELGDPGTGGYTEPNIVSCLSSIPTLMSVHIPTITDKAICDLNTLVGPTNTVQDVLNSQCLGDYLTNPNIIQNPANLAQAAKNREVIICDLINRLTLIENSCCSFGCSDIKIGFLQSYDNTTNTYHITFSYGAGTDIPLVFSDCGSTFIVTDWKGVTKTIINNVNTLHNGSVFNINLSGSGLDVSQPMNLQIKTCFTNNQSGLICKDCFGGTLDASSNLTTSTCWDFAIPKNDVLGCGNKNLVYSNINTSQGVFNFNGNSTSVNGTLALPQYSSSNNLSNILVCTNKITMNITNQSTTNPPEIRLAITNITPTLYINIVGTLNTNCGC